ncbi:MAG: DUF1735 domain-containing protein [Ginsengibacter sp.]
MKQNKYLRLVVIAAMIFSLQSCLKNNSFYTDFSKGKPAVELPLAAVHANAPISVSFDVSNTPSLYYAVVNVASVNKPTSPVTATLGLDVDFMNAYNDTMSAQNSDYVPYELLPDSTYSLGSLDVTIAAGHREDSIPIQIFTNKMAPGHNYMLPLTIVKSSLPISNWNHLMLNIGAKNQFDGVYSVTGTFVDLTNPAFSGDYPKTVSLVTQGLSTDAYFDGDLGGFGYVFYTGSGYSYFGNFDPVFTFDADGNVTAVTNLYTDPAPRSRSAQLDTSPGTVNKFDLNTKSLDVSYYFMQAGAIRGKIHEIFTYKGPR